MRQAAQALGVPALRDVTLDDLPAALARLGEDELVRRTRHVVTENARVLAAVAALAAVATPIAALELNACLSDEFAAPMPVSWTPAAQDVPPPLPVAPALPVPPVAPAMAPLPPLPPFWLLLLLPFSSSYWM